MSCNTRRVVGCPLPGAKLPFLPVLRPGCGVGGRLEGWALVDQILGVPTHYLNGRTAPCTSHLGKCEGCDGLHREPRWAGFLPVLNKQKRRVCIHEITRGAADACEGLERIDRLRGRFVVLQRKGEGINNGVVMSLSQETYSGVLPAVPDVPAALCRFWEIRPDLIGRAIQSENWGGK